MDDAESKNLEKNILKQFIEHIYDGRAFYKSFWLRYGTILIDKINWKFVGG